MPFDFVAHLQELKAPAQTKVATTPKEPAKAAPQEIAPKVTAQPATQKTAAEKLSAFVKVVDNRMAKIAKVIEEERDAEHAQLFKNCVSACFHYKSAGYTIAEREETGEDGEVVKVAYDRAEDPDEFVAMCYNMYKDILNNRG